MTDEEQVRFEELRRDIARLQKRDSRMRREMARLQAQAERLRLAVAASLDYNIHAILAASADAPEIRRSHVDQMTVAADNLDRCLNDPAFTGEGQPNES